MQISKLVIVEGSYQVKIFEHSGDAWYMRSVSNILRYQGRNTVRHYARQRYMDYARRGQSNREGSNTRRYRQYMSQRRPRITVGNLYSIIF